MRVRKRSAVLVPGDLFVSDAIEKFLEYQKVRKGRAQSTIDTYRSALGMFMQHTGETRLSDINISTIDQYADSLDVSSKTLKNRLSPIRSFIRYLYSKELINIRPESIDLPQVKEIEANFLSPEEQEELINLCKDDRERALILLLLRSGVRVSELINIRTDDLYDGSIVVRRGKGGKPRVTFITPDAENAVRKYQDTFAVKPVYLMCGMTGERMSRQLAHRIVTRVADRTSIQKTISPHTLRHTFATNLLQKGARVEDVQPMMGHSNIRTTMIYMHFTNDYLKQRYNEIMTENNANVLT